MNLSFNPQATTVASGGFNVETTGYITGFVYDEPAVRFQLKGGPFTPTLQTNFTDSLPIWGGLPVILSVPPYSSYANVTSANVTSGATLEALGTPVGRASGVADMQGFSVWNQLHSALNFPQSPVPQVPPGMEINYYTFKSLARIALPLDPALTTLVGGSTVASVSWDFYNNRVTAYQASYAANNLTAATWNSGTGLATFTTTSTHGVAVGQSFFITSLTGWNGLYTAVTGTVSSTLVGKPSPVLNSANGYPTYVSGGALAAGGGAIPCQQILDINIGGSMVPVLDASTGYLTWNRSGNAILLQL